METTQNLALPQDRYPITIVSLRVKKDSEIYRDEVIGVYEYVGTVVVKKTVVADGREIHEEVPTRRLVKEEWRSQFEGRIDKLNVSPGQTIADPKQILAVLVEPCGHPIQVRGICATCGKDLSIGDYMGNDMGRATINMAHDNRGVTVSRDVAEKLDKERSQRLLIAQKLTLILDLDQTVVHATVDPTVLQWMNDPQNPNQPFLKDVHKFEIPTYHTHYVKLRPGTREFLSAMNELYEMHIYTMGSRQYADQIAMILDPDRHLFKDRIISRDENRSNFKSIQRLFPSDQSMVVIVDDRSDIWRWSPNLYKILPFNFFVGTGDINAPRLPPSGPPRSGPVLPVSQLVAEPPDDDDEKSVEEKDLSDDVQHQFLDDLEKTRPLEKISEELEEEGDRNTDAMEVDTPAADSATDNVKPKTPTKELSPRRRTVLVDNDRELDRVTEILRNVHHTFYAEKAASGPAPPDVGEIMARQKKDVLRGVKIVFSGVIPSNLNPAQQDIWIGAEQFGAKCSVDLSDDVTHVVTVKQIGTNRTNKVRRARNMPGVFVVKPDWLYDSISRWERQEEEEYLLEEVCRGARLSLETGRAIYETGDDDEAILSGTWEHENDLFIKLGQDDIEAMDAEIEAALAEDDDSDEIDHDTQDTSFPDASQNTDADFDAFFEEGFAAFAEENESSDPPKEDEKRKAPEGER
ncbi:hypothetical protein PhCBS80983_g03118 [Powellomyces hirtus]|uniref:RNA polymerase II subunit A C-terminal domain phosphatase n=1 Tax=Powellomyces hirtus TaxID=109895 RepID=A0A507E3Q5_9FUNG|nr:hypothetical protein PhCBS80983_g03118 [Powellomyces hirtus]